MRISDWSSDVCSSDLVALAMLHHRQVPERIAGAGEVEEAQQSAGRKDPCAFRQCRDQRGSRDFVNEHGRGDEIDRVFGQPRGLPVPLPEFDRQTCRVGAVERSDEHTSELQSLMRISYAVFYLKTNKPKWSLHR